MKGMFDTLKMIAIADDMTENERIVFMMILAERVISPRIASDLGAVGKSIMLRANELAQKD